MTTNKILVKLYVPALDEQYDIWIPVNKRIHTIIKLFVEALKDLTKGYYIPKELPCLYDKTTAKVFDMNLRVVDTDIRNGSELILI